MQVKFSHTHSDSSRFTLRACTELQTPLTHVPKTTAIPSSILPSSEDGGRQQISPEARRFRESRRYWLASRRGRVVRSPVVARRRADGRLVERDYGGIRGFCAKLRCRITHVSSASVCVCVLLKAQTSARSVVLIPPPLVTLAGNPAPTLTWESHSVMSVH